MLIGWKSINKKGAEGLFFLWVGEKRNYLEIFANWRKKYYSVNVINNIKFYR